MLHKAGVGERKRQKKIFGEKMAAKFPNTMNCKFRSKTVNELQVKHTQ